MKESIARRRRVRARKAEGPRSIAKTFFLPQYLEDQN